MRQSKITLNVTLDDQNVPERIYWDATDKPADANAETKSFSLSIWEQEINNTLRIDLWTNEMTVEEMRRFLLQNLAGLAETMLNATGDEHTYTEIKNLAENLAQRYIAIEKEAQAKSMNS